MSDSDELTVESLTKSKEDIFSEHGLEGTALGRAKKKKQAEAEEELTKHQKIVDAKITLQQAREAGVSDPSVDALAEAVGELSSEMEAAALVEHTEEAEAREKISELESLANTSTGAAAASFRKRAEALRSEHGIEADEPNKYSAEALVADGAELEDVDDPDAEALAQFREEKEQREADEELTDEGKKLLTNLRNMREQAKQRGHKKLIQKYDERIESVREEYTE